MNQSCQSVRWHLGDQISIEEKDLLNNELAEKLRGTVGPDIIPWIWSRYTRMAKGTSFDVLVQQALGR
jgi:hypothetical protein